MGDQSALHERRRAPSSTNPTRRRSCIGSRSAARCCATSTHGGRSRRAAPLLALGPEAVPGVLSSRAQMLGFAAAAMIKSDGTRSSRSPPDRTTKLIAKPDPSDFQDAINRRGALRLSRRRQHLRRHFVRSRGPTDSSSTRRAASIRWRRKVARRRRERLQHVGTASRRIGTVSSSPSRPCTCVLALTMLFSAVWLGLPSPTAGRADPPADPRDRRSCRPAISTSRCRRGASEGDLGQLGQTFNKMTSNCGPSSDDIMRGQRDSTTAARLHRGGAFRRAGRRSRRRPRGRVSILKPPPSGSSAAGRREALGRPLDAIEPELELISNRRARCGSAADPGPDTITPRRPRAYRLGARRRSEQRRSDAAMSSRSTTSPSSWRRSAPRPGPTSPAASPTRSRTR